MKKTLSLLLAGLLSVGVAGVSAACGGTKYENDTVVIYKEYNGLVGEGAEKVRKALEEKFKKDTGESIHLNVEATPTSLLGDKVTGALSASKDRIDAIVAHNSSDSLVTQMIGNDKEAKVITDIVKTYAPKYVELTNTGADKTVYRRGLSGGKLYSVNSTEENSIFAMMVNKNHMANTSFDPEKYDVANEGYESLTIDEFTRLLHELKENNPTVVRPLAAAPYDIEYFIAPVFGNCGYTHMQKVGDRIYPAYATESYLSVLEYERMLQTERLWIENPTSNTSSRRDFMAGKQTNKIT